MLLKVGGDLPSVISRMIDNMKKRVANTITKSESVASFIIDDGFQVKFVKNEQ